MIRTSKEQRARLMMRSHTLQQRQSIADSIRRCGGKLRGIKQRVHRYDLLEQRSHDTCHHR